MIGTLSITYHNPNIGSSNKRLIASEHKKYLNTVSLVQSMHRAIKDTLLVNKDALYYVNNALQTYRERHLNRLVTKLYTLAFNVYGKECKVTGYTLSEIKSRRRETIREIRSRRRTLAYSTPERHVRSYGYVRCRTVGGVHTEPGFFLKMRQSRLSKLVFEPKKPMTSEHHVGIELEFTAKADRQTLGVSLFEAGVAEFVTLKSDGSIRVEKNGHHAHELAICVPESKLEEIVRIVTKTLAKHEACVNKSTGMHTHIDVRNRNRHKVFGRLVSAQSVLYAMQPKSRRDNNYCKRTKSRELDTAYNAGRYQGVNPQAADKYSTIEVRLHAGTVSFEKIVNWVKLLIAIVDGDYVEPIRAPRTLDTFCKTYKIGDDLRSYIKSRLDKFSRIESADEVESA